MRTLIIDDIAIPTAATAGLSQSYRYAYDGTTLPMMDGSSRKLYLGPQRLETTISARGWCPFDAAAIDTAIAHEIHCVAERVVNSATTAIEAPGTYREDLPPICQAIVGGQIVVTPWSEGVATAVSGASGYRLLYWPILTCWVEIEESGEPFAAEYSWTLKAREA